MSLDSQANYPGTKPWIEGLPTEYSSLDELNPAAISNPVSLTIKETAAYGVTHDSTADGWKLRASRTGLFERENRLWFFAEYITGHQVHRMEIAVVPRPDYKHGKDTPKPVIDVRIYEDGGRAFGTQARTYDLVEIVHNSIELEDDDE